MWLLCNQPRRGEEPARTVTVGQVMDDAAARGVLTALVRELLAVARRAVRSALRFARRAAAGLIVRWRVPPTACGGPAAPSPANRHDMLRRSACS